MNSRIKTSRRNSHRDYEREQDMLRAVIRNKEDNRQSELYFPITELAADTVYREIGTKDPDKYQISFYDGKQQLKSYFDRPNFTLEEFNCMTVRLEEIIPDNEKTNVLYALLSLFPDQDSKEVINTLYNVNSYRLTQDNPSGRRMGIYTKYGYLCPVDEYRTVYDGKDLPIKPDGYAVKVFDRENHCLELPTGEKEVQGFLTRMEPDQIFVATGLPKYDTYLHSSQLEPLNQLAQEYVQNKQQAQDVFRRIGQLNATSEETNGLSMGL